MSIDLRRYMGKMDKKTIVFFTSESPVKLKQNTNQICALISHFYSSMLI